MRLPYFAVRPPGFSVFLALVFQIASVSCQSKSKNGSGGRPAGSALSGPTAKAAPLCREIKGASPVVMGASTAGATPSEEDQDLELPFSVELGEARSGSKGFAVGALEVRGGASFALFAFLDATTAQGSVLELGRVSGDGGPPAVAPVGDDRFLIAVPNMDASGAVLQLSSVSAPFRSEDVRHAGEVTSVPRDGSGFALAVQGTRGLLVWSTLEKGRGQLAAAVIDPSATAHLGQPSLLPLSPEAEAEAPRLIARPSGYYLAYVTRTPGKQNAARPALAEGEAIEDLLEDGPSAIELVPLDPGGVPSASARRITPPAVRVVAFDIGLLPDGGALVIYGDDRGGPGLDRPNLQAVWVRADGSSDTRTWELAESSGLPAILVDPAPPRHGKWGFLMVPGEQGARFTALGSDDPLQLGELLEEPALKASELLALGAGRVLRAQLRGTQRELSLLECTSP